MLLAGQTSSLVYLSFMVSKYSKNPSQTVIVLQSQFPIAHKKSLIENYTRATMVKYKSLERVWTTQDLTLEWRLFFRQASCILDSPLHDKEESIKVSSLMPVVVGVLELIRERMDQNLGKIRGVSDIDELQKISLPVHTNGAHTEKVSVHRIKKLP